MLKQGNTWFSLVPEPRNLIALLMTIIENSLNEEIRQDAIILFSIF